MHQTTLYEYHETSLHCIKLAHPHTLFALLGLLPSNEGLHNLDALLPLESARCR